jgi:thiamine-phosphate pyrophosphorylase
VVSPRRCERAAPVENEARRVLPLRLPRLYPILDVDAASRAGRTVRQLAEWCFGAGAGLVQLRMKHAVSGEWLATAREVVDMAGAFDAKVIINDRVDIAAITRATGVHLGQDDLPVEATRTLLGADAWIGLSTHTEEQLRAALVQPLDYVAIGPVFVTATKDPGYGPLGLEGVARAAALKGTLPLVAIGGVTIDRARSVIDAGADSVAVISDIVAADRPAERVRHYLRALDHSD